MSVATEGRKWPRELTFRRGTQRLPERGAAHEISIVWATTASNGFRSDADASEPSTDWTKTEGGKKISTLLPYYDPFADWTADGFLPC